MDNWTKEFLKKANDNIEKYGKDYFVDEILSARNSAINDMNRVICTMRYSLLERGKKDPDKKHLCRFGINLLDEFDRLFKELHFQGTKGI